MKLGDMTHDEMLAQLRLRHCQLADANAARVKAEQEWDAARQEADLLRRQVKLVEPLLEWTNCEVCPARGQTCGATRDDVPCGEVIFAWAAQQTNEGGK